jgi:hypothetical protein
VALCGRPGRGRVGRAGTPHHSDPQRCPLEVGLNARLKREGSGDYARRGNDVGWMGASRQQLLNARCPSLSSSGSKRSMTDARRTYLFPRSARKGRTWYHGTHPQQQDEGINSVDRYTNNTHLRRGGCTNASLNHGHAHQCRGPTSAFVLGSTVFICTAQGLLTGVGGMHKTGEGLSAAHTSMNILADYLHDVVHVHMHIHTHARTHRECPVALSQQTVQGRGKLRGRGYGSPVFAVPSRCHLGQGRGGDGGE